MLTLYHVCLYHVPLDENVIPDAIVVIHLVLHKLHLFGKIRKSINQISALLILKAMLLPVIDYGDDNYLSACKRDLNKLQVLLNKALRIAYGKYDGLPVNDLHHWANIGGVYRIWPLRISGVLRVSSAWGPMLASPPPQN